MTQKVGPWTLEVDALRADHFPASEAAAIRAKLGVPATVDAAALGSANVFTETQAIKSSDAGASEGPVLELFRDSASPLAADDIGVVRFQGRDSAGNLENYAKIVAIILDPTVGSEDAKLAIKTVVAGALAARLNIGAGLWMEGATGGDPGAGKINAAELQVNGVVVQSRAYLEYRDEKAAGTAGGTFTSGAWQTRTINTEHSDAAGLGSVAANQITLPAGTYEVDISCPAAIVGTHQAMLYNVTDAATALIGHSAQTATGSTVVTHAKVTGRFTIAGTKVFEVRHRCTTTRATDGFGIAANFGETEIYTVARFWKVG